MKKIIVSILFSISLGIILGKTTFDKYNSLNSSYEIDNTIYVLKFGTYNSLDEMQNDLSIIDRYIYIKEDNTYKAYISVSKTKSSINKLKNIYDKTYSNLNIENINIDNEEFIQNLNEYEKLLNETTDENALLTIENQILSSYEKMVVNNE